MQACPQHRTPAKLLLREYLYFECYRRLPQPVCRFVSRVVRKCKVKKKQGRKRCARAGKTEVLLFEHRTRLSMLGGDPLATCTLPVGECYVLTYLRSATFRMRYAKQARSEWECARFIYPRYELLYELRRVETAATAGTAVMHQQVTNKHQPPGLSEVVVTIGALPFMHYGPGGVRVGPDPRPSGLCPGLCSARHARLGSRVVVDWPE